MRRPNIAEIRSVLLSIVGMKYQELPWDTCREEVDAALADLGAKKCPGDPDKGNFDFDATNEYFRIGNRKIRLLTEEYMGVSLWGRKKFVNQLYGKIMEKIELRKAKRH
jgi:hypothetical protein